MSVAVVDFLFFLFVASAGVFVGWWLRGNKSKALPASPADDDAERAQEALARLHELAADVAHDVGEHSNRVQEISDELSAGAGQDADAVIDAVARLISTNEKMQHQLDSAEEKLQEQAEQIKSRTAEALTDALTQLANRRAFDDELARRGAEFERHGTPVCVMILDIDHFKKFNDTHGHQAGDEVLRGVADVLRQSSRSMDVVARYGGEEFAVILPATAVTDARPSANRVRKAIEEARFEFQGVELRVTTSVGLAQLMSGENPESMVKRSDEGLYKSKEAGRNCSHWHDGQECHLIEAAPPSPPAPDGGKSSQPERPTETKQELAPQETKPQETPDAEASNGESPEDVEGGLSSKASFRNDVQRRLAEQRRGGAPVSVILVEVDDYPQIISRFGQQAGDMAMRAATQFLLAAMREMDHISRYGGETFALLLPGAALKNASQVAERLRAAVSRCVLPFRNERLSFTVSLGVTEAIAEDDVDRILQRAEDALNVAESNGNNGTCIHNGKTCELVSASQNAVGAAANPNAPATS